MPVLANLYYLILVRSNKLKELRLKNAWIRDRESSIFINHKPICIPPSK